MPPFDLSDSGGIGLVLLRGLADLCCVGLFGTAVLRLWVAPAGIALMPTRAALLANHMLRRVTGAAGGAALLSLALWLVGTARMLADATSLPETLAAIGIVLRDTSFGHVVMVQSLAVLVAMLCAPARGRVTQASLLAATAVAVMLQACHGHAFAMGNDGLLAIACLHLLAGGAWLGGLPALLALCIGAPGPAILALSRRFSPMGQIAVLLILVSALIQGLVMIETPANLFGTAYGWTALAKMFLLTLLVLAAATNRFVATPSIAAAPAAESGQRLLRRSLAIELVCGILVILAAALLASLPPVMQM